jgi:hypothetical protein
MLRIFSRDFRCTWLHSTVIRVLVNKKTLLCTSILAALPFSIIAFKGTLHGILMHCDLAFPLDMCNWMTPLVSTWNPWNDCLSEHIPKAAMMFVSESPSLLLGLSSKITQKLFLTLTLSFASIMTLFSTFILLFRKDLNLYGLKNFLVCLITSLFFKFNPWIALQIEQHIWFVLACGAFIFLHAVFIKMIFRQ